MKIASRRHVLVSSLVLAVSVSVLAAPKAKKDWNTTMRALYGTLADLLPNVTSDARFNDPRNYKRIEEDAKKLSQTSHGMTTTSTPPEADPSITIIAGMLQSESRRAYEELKQGRRSYAQALLKTIPSMCIGCHTRTEKGVDLSFAKMEPPQSFVSGIERGEFYAASRQFDRALDEFERVVDDPAAAKGKQLEWERSVRYALAISVRVKKDPDRAIKIVDRVIASPAAPQFLKEDATRWRASLTDWQGELARTPKTEEGLFAEAKRLLSKALQNQKYPMDRTADVDYLRLTAVLHDLLNTAPKGPHVPETLLMLGVGYEALRDLNLWSLHEMYYEACVRSAPHTDIAQSCYNRYEATTFSGFTGTGGMSLPEDVRSHLAELKGLAETQKASKP